ncbi:MAG: ribosome biogenesis GTP-binding protein YihA/YsxC [Defluviitaleaceae bacterium]|nr:ribosome biogenesis GTP-binding protein YihA/YsxC [Defluviitaleaceae bacterium]MCL2836798.1 ribosome biogenesis GTP-binding protein YihA/YsxC [Defluviitaleaceae bacterium]
MIINNVSLEATVVAKSGFPAKGLPEAALCGRSNVGKSSLINAMVGRKALARTSQSPGKTRTINFYNVEDALFLVDLPGYGYAKAAKSEKQKWGGMIEGYLKAREELRVIALLLDIRHQPTENDRTMHEFIKYYGYQMIAVLTKADKIARGKVAARAADIRGALALPGTVPIIPFSAETKQGRGELWETIMEFTGLTTL